ncbi:MAG: phytanoyl-CoA dioxygenase family protein [Chitinophagales bacterium]
MEPVNKVPPIFRDPALQQQLDEIGYVKLPLLDEEKINALEKLFYQFHADFGGNRFQASSYLADPALKTAIRQALYPFFHKRFEEIFTNYTYFGSSFLFKPPGKSSDLAPHQDWTIVDETRFIALNIWMPLTDTNVENGTLQVIPKSHYPYLPTLRAPTIPFFFQHYERDIINCFHPIDTKAGEAIILNQSLLHYSAPNQTNEVRIAITSGIKTASAPMQFYFQEKESIECFEMPEDFLLAFKDFQRDIYTRPSNGRSMGFVNYQPPAINKQAFWQQFPPVSQPWWKQFLPNWL